MNSHQETDLAGLDVAIRLKAELLHALATTNRSRWQETVLRFVAALEATRLADSTALVVLLTELRQELRLLLFDAQSRKQPLPRCGTPEIWAGLAPSELRGQFRDEILQWLLPAVSSDRLPSPLVQRAKDLVDERYAERLTLADVAAAVGRSKRHLAALFRQELAMTLHDYLTRVRLRRAVELIREGKKIEAVSLLVGYRSKKNFYRHFKALTGMTPMAYRAALFQIDHAERPA